MKKTFRFIAAMVAVFMLILQINVFATIDEPRLGVGMGENDVIKVEGSEVAVSEAGYLVSKTASTQTNNKITVSYHINNLAIFKVPFPTLESGKLLDSVHFRFGGAKDSGYRLIKISGASVSPANMLLSGSNGNNSLVTTDGNVIISKIQDAQNQANTDQITNVTSINAEFLGLTYIHLADISAYAKECFETNKQYFYIGVYNTAGTTSVCSNVVLSNTVNGTGYNYLDLNPYLYYTTKDVPPMEFVTSSPADGSENVVTSTPVSFTFNHAIASASAIVNDEEVSCSIDGTTVTLADISLSQYADYYIKITATDVYNSTLTKTISFTTGVAVAGIDLKDGLSWAIGSSAPASLKDTAVGLGAGGKFNNVALFEIPLSELKGKIPSSFSFSWGQNGSANRATLLKFPGEQRDTTTMSIGDSDVSEILTNAGDYTIPWTGQQTTEIGSYTSGGTYTVYRYTNDISEYIAQCIADGQDYAYVGLVCGWSCSVYGFSVAQAKTARYSYTAVEPEMKSVNATVDVSGKTLNALSFDILTVIDDAADYVSLRNASTKEVVEDAVFEYDAIARTIALVEPVSLNEKTDYEVVIAGGTEDNFGNVLSSDYIVTVFTTDEDMIVMKSKIVLESTQVTDFDEAVNIETLDSAQGYKAVTTITNNTNQDVAFKVIIAKYDSDNLMTNVAVKDDVVIEAHAQDCIVESNAIDINGEGSYIKAFVWIGDNNKPVCVASESEIAQ